MHVSQWSSTRTPSLLRSSLALVVFGAAAAVQADTTYDEQYKLIKAPNAVATFGADLFGDRVNLYTGGLEFLQTDISLPGNNRLPVSIGRKLVTGNSVLGGRQFGRWEADIPHLHGVFSASKGWVSPGGSAKTRCSDFGPPADAAGVNNRSAWAANEFWQGNFMYVPAVGDQQMLLRDPGNLLVPGGDGAAYPIVTNKFWSITCLASLANDTSADKAMGQGFLAVAPDGTRYRFDWMTDFAAGALLKSDPMPGLIATASPDQAKSPPPVSAPDPSLFGGYAISRKEVWILPTLVTDRFGNWVRYTYDPARPRRVTKIESSDQRVLTFGYTTGDDSIKSVSDGTRTWRYAYANGDLTAVTLPDSSSWQFGNTYGIMQRVIMPVAGDCESPAPLSPAALSGTMLHPSGAVGRFAVTPTTHGRSDVPYNCVYTAEGVRNAILRWFYTNSLTSKTISGAGLGSLTWRYDYGPADSSWSSCGGCTTSKTVSVTDPAGRVSRHTFGNRYGQTEGRIEQVDVDGLRTTVTRYRALGAGPYIDRLGSGDTIGGDSDLLARLAPEEQRVTTQQGITLTWTANSFDPRFARPTVVTRASSLPTSRSETTAYADNLTSWVLGQVASVTEAATGKKMVANSYNLVTANLETVSQFGLLQQTLTYYPDGTLATRKDGKNQVTTYSRYMRGIPQTVEYADRTSESAVVNNIGRITALTNAAGYTTTFDYDAAGRLALLTHPTADSVAWNATRIAFYQSASAQFDLPAGHWRQEVTTGQAHLVHYYDGLWRPVYTERWDDANRAGTMRITGHQYDFAGRTSFESYPQRSYGQLGSGVATAYDALGRVTGTRSDSELGSLTTSSTYHANFQKTFQDARNNSTTTSYQVFDEPSESAITHIVAPEGVVVDIERDVFGKPRAITRSGGGKSATRKYVYDGYERLCKTIEPETASTVQSLDAANNVSWRATGLALPSATACDTASVPTASKMTFGYDSLNRLTSTVFGDGSPAISRSYTADGLPDTVKSNGIVWTNSYNKRRLNERESMAYGGATYNVDRAYDVNGSLRLLTYPDATSIDYAPNALGEPTKAGKFASAVTYHPNGAIAGFTYGNGIVHTLAQNTRGLPEVSNDAGVLKDKYGYDENANVKAIDDQQEGISNRAMSYDNLDRLRVTSSAATFGTVTNTYDTLDNLTKVIVTQGPTARTTIHDIDPATNRLKAISSATSAYNLGFGYDSQGNITTRGGQRFVFDQGNRLKSATGKATYGYDGLGHRASTVGTDGVNRVSVYTQGGQLLYLRSTSAPLAAGTRYIYLGRHQIAEVKAAGAN